MIELANQIARWRQDPASMVRELFNVEPDAWQLEVLNAFPSNPRIAMKAAKGVGKTCLLSWCIWNFLLTRPSPGILCLSTSERVLADTLWTELARWHQKSPLLQSEFIWTKKQIYHKDNQPTWWCTAKSFPQSADKMQQGQALAGFHPDYALIVLDESGGMNESIMASAEAALSTATEGHILQAGNPTHLEGCLYAACTRDAARWKVVEISSDPDSPLRSPRVSIEWAKQQIESYGRNNPWVLVNVFGQFPPSSLNSLIGPDEIRAAMKRYYREYQIGRAPRIMGVDVARFGDDASAIACRHGIQMLPFKKYRNLDSMQGAGRVAREWEEFKADACFIDNTGGFGAGWIDQLRALHRNPMGVHFAGQPHKVDRYANKRAEMYFDFCEWIKEGGSLPECPDLISALTATTYTFTNRGLLIIEPKEVIKAKLNGVSPDEADAAALTFAEPVLPSDSSLIRRRTSYECVNDYDPFKE